MTNTSKMEMKAKDSEDKKQGTNESNVENSIFPLPDVSPIETLFYRRRRSGLRKSTAYQQLDYTVKRVAHGHADIFKTISWNDYLRAKYGSVEGSLVKESSSKRKSTVEIREMPSKTKERIEPIKNVKEVSLDDGFISQRSNGDTKEVPEITVTSSEQKDLIKNGSEKVLGKGNRTKSSAKIAK
ncbi:hypothetical protein ACOME3_010625 [Neoechinorhynchus agilis]